MWLRGWGPVLRTVIELSPQLLRSALVGGTSADDTKERLFTRLLGGLPNELVNERVLRRSLSIT